MDELDSKRSEFETIISKLPLQKTERLQEQYNTTRSDLEQSLTQIENIMILNPL